MLHKGNNPWIDKMPAEDENVNTGNTKGIGQRESNNSYFSYLSADDTNSQRLCHNTADAGTTTHWLTLRPKPRFQTLIRTSSQKTPNRSTY